VLKVPPKVDCRGHLILDDPTMVDAQGEQIIVVGSWLTVKETSLLMAELINCWYMKDVNVSLLTYENVEAIGNQLLRSLLSLKHMGAIASAGQAFYIMCKRLFAEQDRSADVVSKTKYSTLPYTWLNNLLNRVDGGGESNKANAEQFFLRRSTGFATAFSSILRSEPTATRVESMKKAMRRLFDAAVPNKNVNDWRRRVHSLNVLKMVFEDAWLSTDLQPHASDAMELAINGFRSTSWAVRNSSMMLFAATMRSTVGKRREKDDKSRRNRTTGDQFFGRFPALYSYFRNELIDASQYSDATNMGNTSNDRMLAGDMHPTLFPILLVLTRLEPSPNGRGTSKPALHDLNAFVPYLKESAKDAHHKARVMSARALSAILSPEYVMETLSNIIDETKQPSVYQFHNSLHGSMLIILSVCEHLLYNRMDTVNTNSRVNAQHELHMQIYEFCQYMIQHVLPKSGNITSCFPVFAALMDIIKLFSTEAKLFIEMGIQFAKATMSDIINSKILLQFDIGGTHLLESCAEYLALYDSISSILKNGLLNNEIQEVTVIALKQIKHRVKKTIEINVDVDFAAISKQILSNLFHGSTATNNTNKGPFILRHELRLLDLCNLKAHVSGDEKLRNNLYVYLNNIVEIHTASNSPRVVGEAISLLGQVVESIMLSGVALTAPVKLTPAETMGEFLCILQACSTDEQDMYVRYGCIVALSHISSYFKLTHWKICLRLLQDDDKDVRNSARNVIGNILNCVNYCDGALLRQAYAYLGSDTAAIEKGELTRYLVDKIESIASTLIAKMNSTASKTRMVTSLQSLFNRPIFETEEMNMHIEVLGEVQLASEILLNLLKYAKGEAEENAFVTKSGKVFMSRINALINDVKQNNLANNSNTHWLGGITYDSGVFASFVANIMGARACNIDLSSAFSEARKSGLLLHPMIIRIGVTMDSNTMETKSLFAV
jgi:hypothetical protein